MFLSQRNEMPSSCNLIALFGHYYILLITIKEFNKLEDTVTALLLQEEDEGDTDRM